MAAAPAEEPGRASSAVVHYAVLADLLAEFRHQHELAKKGLLPPGERQLYEARRGELARALVMAQHLTLKPRQTWRQALRVARALQVEVDLPSGKERTVTVDISIGGLSALVATHTPVNHVVAFSLRIPSGDPIAGRARVASSISQHSVVRLSLAFEDLSDADRERIEIVVFDAVLAMFAA